MERYYMKGFDAADSWRLYRVAVNGNPATEIFKGSRFQVQRLKDTLFFASESWLKNRARQDNPYTVKVDEAAANPWCICNEDGIPIVGQLIEEAAIEICNLLNAERTLYLEGKSSRSVHVGIPASAPWR